MNANKLLKLLSPLIIFICLAPFTPKLDIHISHIFYDSNISNSFQKNGYIMFMYHYGMIPAFTLCTLSILAFCLSFYFPKLTKWRIFALALNSSLVIGPGILINLILKNHWGRPRPIQISHFGGSQEFSPFYIPHFGPDSAFHKSFPSGHCSMGFFFLIVCLVGKRLQHRGIFLSGLTLTIFLSLSLAYTRLALGGHFFSDILAAGLFMWYVSLFVEWLVFDKHIFDKLVTKMDAIFNS